MYTLIDTRPGGSPFFSPPDTVVTAEQYAQWLSDRIAGCQRRDGDRMVYSGTAQRINAIASLARRDDRPVDCIGPFAAQAAEVAQAFAGEFPVEVVQ